MAPERPTRTSEGDLGVASDDPQPRTSAPAETPSRRQHGRFPAQLRGPMAICTLALLAAIAAWQAPPLTTPGNSPLGSTPTRIMGTTCRLLAVPPQGVSGEEAAATAGRALAEAEAALRAVEAEMSTRIDDSPLSHLNRAKPRESVSLPTSTMEVLRASQAAWHDTAGAFDVTCRPVIELWKAAGRQRQAPTDAEVEAVRRRSTWSGLRLDATSATKLAAGVEVDLGGIAKGWAIDLAVARMVAAGAAGGLVDVGGDLRVFGAPPAGGPWEVQVQNPFATGTILTLRMPAGAVCTSGDYFRYVEIGRQRLSHIVDPRTGHPTAGVHSVTVIAPTATGADVWATALSVLGEAGLARLPAAYEAMLVLGERDAPRAVATPRLPSMIVDGPPFPLETCQR